MRAFLKKISFLGIFFFTLTLVSTASFGHINQTASVKKISQIIDTATQHSSQETLVIFDVDDVLIIPVDQIFHPQHNEAKKAFANRIKEKYPPKEESLFSSIVLKYRRSELVDPNMLTLIKDLKHQDIKTIALTAAGTGRHGLIQSLEDWRINELKSFGIDFNYTFPNLAPMSFTHIKTNYPYKFPAYKQGIIFSMDVPKGKVLSAFLAKLCWTPKTIIFIDDKMHNLLSVQDFCEQKHIKYVGIQYTATTHIKSGPLNKERAELQFQLLLKHKQWVSDQELDKVLKSSKKN